MTETVLETQTFPMTITEAAVKQIKRLLIKKGDESLILRLGVKGGGCSGLSYVMKFEETARETDLLQTIDGVRIIIDPKSATFFTDATLDYSTANLLDGGWKWTNPNAGQSCGCGTSFTPKA
jgi:iron-sulfur cluster assembly protein